MVEAMEVPGQMVSEEVAAPGAIQAMAGPGDQIVNMEVLPVVTALAALAVVELVDFILLLIMLIIQYIPKIFEQTQVAVELAY
jgi:hypothetical protein